MNLSFSVIIPVYNMERFLARCLDSLAKQTYDKLEIILINDGSIDASGAICDSYAEHDTRFRVIHQANAGVSEARNAGLKIASGDYISFVDPDDWVEANMYQTIASHLADKQIDILRFNAYRKGELVNTLPFKGLYEGKRLEEEVVLPLIGAEKFGGMFILGVLWMHVYKRSTIEKHHICFNKALRRCEDRLFTLTTALYADQMMFIDDVFYHYEVNDDSLSNKYDPQRWLQELIYLDELQKIYKQQRSSIFIENADKRILGEYLLRAITSINNEFFSKNNNTFVNKYKNTKTIINNPIVRTAIKKTPKESMGLKGKIIWASIDYQQPLFLSIFNIVLLYKNRLTNHG
ncbi:MAG: hypothetical protein RL662_2206 [Bacteroidota bacterium]|jgi:glycosyltransferase EpsJ